MDHDNFMHMLQAFEFRNEIWVLILPLILMGIDVGTGFINAWAKHEIQSSKLRSGLGKKVGEIAVLVIGEFFSFALKIPPDVMKFLSFYIILMEIISILENLDKLGVPIPKFVSKVLNNAEETIVNKTEVQEVATAIEAVKEVETDEQDRKSDPVDGENSKG